jgi:hypothetical protein
MDATLIVLVIALVVIVAVAVVVLGGARRRSRLRERFGPEYERAVASGDRKEAEADLRGRLDARQKLDIRPLSEAERDSYGSEWQEVQAEFVDQPDGSLADADALVERLMRDRGYPVDDFEQQADLVSVDHPDVVEHYRKAHGVFVAAGGGDDGGVATEDMRQALVSYRALFAVLLDDPAGDPTKEREGSR